MTSLSAIFKTTVELILTLANLYPSKYFKAMNTTSRNGFVHSVKVPRIYKTASVIAKKVVEEGGSLKNLVYSCGHKNIKGVYALVVETIKHSQELDRLIKISKIFEKETRLQPWLGRILLTELLFGKKELKSESKPVQTVLSYKKQFEKLLKNNKNSPKNSEIGVINKETRQGYLFNNPLDFLEQLKSLIPSTYP